MRLFRNTAVARLGISAAIVATWLQAAAGSSVGVHEIDPARSTITVHVSKTGMFRVFGDNHDIRAPISHGVLDAPHARVSLVVTVNQMRVVDPNLSADNRDQVQTRMLGPDVLDAARFPEIRFESNEVTLAGPGEWSVRGTLALHGETHPLTMMVSEHDGHYKGSASFRQTTFGITPVTAAGGTVKVKDEVTVEFDIVVRSTDER